MHFKLEDKKRAVKEINTNLVNTQILVLAEYRGIKVSSLTKLRSEARGKNVYLRVLKNTLARRAVQGTTFEPLADQMVGPLIYAASEEPVSAAKLLHAYSKKESALVIKAGSFGGEVLSAAKVAELASILPKEELLAKMAGLMKAPLATFARALAALVEKRQEAEAEIPANAG